jgi:hypothetical protein
MQLRDHPLMTTRNGANIWPPTWSTTGQNDTPARGEVGILRYVKGSSESRKCFLVMEHENNHYVGTLWFRDLAFCSQICDILQQNIGRSIKEIGDLDLSYNP